MFLSEGQMEKLLLTEREVGELTGLSRSTLRKLWSAGVLGAPLKIGRSIRWPMTDIEAFIARLREEAQDSTS
jgi:excisionase family DNA binding protein